MGPPNSQVSYIGMILATINVNSTVARRNINSATKDGVLVAEAFDKGSQGVIFMSVIRFSSVVLLLSVVFFIGCAPQTEEIQLAVAGLD